MSEAYDANNHDANNHADNHDNNHDTGFYGSEFYDDFIFPHYITLLHNCDNHGVDDPQHFEILREFLRNYFANPNIVNASGDTILHIFCKMETNMLSRQTLKIVLETGVNAHIENNKKMSVFSMLVTCNFNNAEIIMIDIINTMDVQHIQKIITYSLIKKFHDEYLYNIMLIIVSMTDIISNKISKDDIKDMMLTIIKYLINFYNHQHNHQYNHQTQQNVEQHIEKCVYIKEKIFIELAKNFDFNEEFDEGMKLYEYFYKKTPLHHNKHSITKFIGKLTDIKNSVLDIKDKNMHEHYLLYGTGCCYGTQQDPLLLEARSLIKKALKPHMAYLLSPYDHGSYSPLMNMFYNRDIQYASECLGYIMDNIEKLHEHKINIINVKDLWNNNILHYIFCVCDNNIDPIFKKFYETIMNSEYKYLAYETNIKLNTPYDIMISFHYFSFGKHIVDMDGMIELYEKNNVHTLMHSLVKSSYHCYISYDVNYIPVDNNDEKYMTKKITYHKTDLRAFMMYKTNPKVYDNKMGTVTTKKVKHIGDCPNYVPKQHFYVDNGKTVTDFMKNESVVDIAHLKLLEEFCNRKPSVVHTKDIFGMNCYMVSVYINSILHVEFFVNFYKKHFNNELLKDELLCCSNSKINVFHMIAHNGNENMFDYICSQFSENDNKILSESFMKKDNLGKTPLHICAHNRNFSIFERMLNRFEFIDKATMYNLSSAICFNPEYDDNDMHILKKLEVLSRKKLYRLGMVDRSKRTVHDIIHFCAYNKCYNLLKYLLTSIEIENYRAVTTRKDYNNLTVFGIGVTVNDCNVIDILSNNHYIASDDDHITLLNLIGGHRTTEIFRKIIRSDMIDINYEYNGIKLLHKVCEYGNIELVKELINKSCSNGVNNFD